MVELFTVTETRQNNQGTVLLPGFCLADVQSRNISLRILGEKAMVSRFVMAGARNLQHQPESGHPGDIGSVRIQLHDARMRLPHNLVLHPTLAYGGWLGKSAFPAPIVASVGPQIFNAGRSCNAIIRG
jgi:hypothetical protein